MKLRASKHTGLLTLAIAISAGAIAAPHASAADRPRRSTTTVAPTTTIAPTTTAITTTTTLAPPTTVVAGAAFTCRQIASRVSITMSGQFSATGQPLNVSTSYTYSTVARSASFAALTRDPAFELPGTTGWSGFQPAGSPTAATDTKWHLIVGPVPASGAFTLYELVESRDATGTYQNILVAPAVPCQIVP